MSTPPAPAPTTPSFFQPGRTYRNQAWTFTCRAISPHPDPHIQGTWAIGWHQHDTAWLVAEFGPDDWKRGDWTDITPTERTPA